MSFWPDPKVLGKKMVLRKASKYVHQICNSLGPERLEWHVVNDVPLSKSIPPKVEQQLRAVAPQWSWVSNAITDADFVAMLPEWVVQLVTQHGEKGAMWLAGTMEWLRSFLTVPLTVPMKARRIK